MRRLCNKVKANTDLLSLFWTSRLQLPTGRNLGPTSPWTSEKNPYFHTPVNPLFLFQTLCCGYSLQLSLWDSSNEYP